MIPFGLVLAILGLGIMLPAKIGGIVIGALPLVTGLYIFSKGQELKQLLIESFKRCGTMLMLLCFHHYYGQQPYSVQYSVTEGYQEYTLLVADSSTSVLWLDYSRSLAWIVIAFLTSTAGFMFLRLRRGSFSGRLIVLSIFGMVVYSFVDSALQISTEVLNGQSYEFSVNQILDDLFYPIIWVVVLWMATTIKNSLQAKQAQSERYWEFDYRINLGKCMHCFVAHNSTRTPSELTTAIWFRS